MFIRIKSTPNSPRKSVQICENRREDGKVRQHVVRHVGIAENEQHADELKLLANMIKKELESERIGQTLFQMPDLPEKELKTLQKNSKTSEPHPIDVDLTQLKETSRIVEGFHDTFGTLFDQLQLNRILPKKQTEVLKDLVLARIADPGSKRYTQSVLAADFGRHIHLDRIYRMMDAITPLKEEFQKRVFAGTEQLCFGDVGVLLFDVTTLYFESVEEDELRNFGFSKDQKFHTTQVVLALATASNGLPIGYRLFRGDTADVSTLLDCLEDWKRSLPISRVLFVADRAMMCEKNLTALEQAGVSYVVAAKLKKLPKSLTEQILSGPRQTNGEPALQDITLPNGRRLVTTHTLARQRKDEKDRIRGIERLQKKIGKGKNLKKLVPNYGYQKFLKVEGDGKLLLDEEKMHREEIWDGLHGVISNIKGVPGEELIAHYSRLWIIKESFRIHKHNLSIRPIYHFNPDRIEAHILICFLAFTLIRHMERRLEIQQEKISIEEMRQSLWRVQASLLLDHQTDKRYRLPSSMNREAKMIYQALGIRRKERAEEILAKSNCSA